MPAGPQISPASGFKLGQSLTLLSEQELTGAGNYAEVPGAKIYVVQAGGPGGGGASGRARAAGAGGGGGGSGGNGAWVSGVFYASELAFPVPYSCGTGGAGGAAVVGVVASGNAGARGTTTTFGTGANQLRALGGAGGNGGLTAGGSAGDTPGIVRKGDASTPPTGVPTWPNPVGIDGTAGGSGTGLLVPVEDTPFGAGRSGAGGGVNTSNAEQAGRDGAAADGFFGTRVAGGAGGAAGGGTGADGATGSTSKAGSGAGGGGSSASSAVAGGAGGAGKATSGGGGGGAGTILAAVGSSGVGGVGGNGRIVVRAYG